MPTNEETNEEINVDAEEIVEIAEIPEEEIKKMVEQYESILSNLNITFVGIIYNDTTTFFKEASEASVKVAIEEIEKDIHKYIETKKVLPPMVPLENLMEIIGGIHQNILGATLSELTMDSVLKPFIKDMQKAIIDTVSEFDSESSEAKTVKENTNG